MRKALFAVLLFLCAASVSHAQATIAFSASHIQGLNGAALTSGSICLQATDSNNVNIGIQVEGGGTVISTPFCTAVTNGAIVTFNVPNPSTATPTGVRYRITITQGARTVASFPGAYLCLASGACTTPWTFNFDTCLSTGACVANPIPIVAGPGGPPGPTGPAGPSGPINQIYANGSAQTVEPFLNLISGTLATVSCVDNGGATRTDCTFASTAGNFSNIGSGTNTSSAFVLGTGSSLTVSGTGTNTANRGSPAGTSGDCMQWGAAGAFTDAGAPCGTGSGVSLSSDNRWTSNNRFKGPIPYRDVTAYMPQGGCDNTASSTVLTYGTISSTSTALTIGADNTFRNGCGIFIMNAGPISTLSTPGQGGAPNPVVINGAGATTVHYKVAAIDANYGLSIASAAITITTAPSTRTATNYVAHVLDGRRKCGRVSRLHGSNGRRNLRPARLFLRLHFDDG